jgi:hypothetical protein
MLLAKDIFEIDCAICNNTRILRDASPQISPLRSPLSAKLPPKQLLSPNNKFEDGVRKSPDGRILEKSNSLTESNSTKQLKVTHSPRPSIKKEKAVDEGTPKVIVKVSAADSNEGSKNRQSGATNLLKVDIDLEKQKNRSTSCLVYVPSDPWTKMTDIERNEKEQKKGSKRMKKLIDVKSLSKPDLNAEYSDPWVKLNKDESRISEKSATYRQSKSFHVDSARPRLKRSKSPSIIQTVEGGDLSLSPTLGYQLVLNKNGTTGSARHRKRSQQQQQFLNVSNPNLLQQSRHSFSTSPTSSSSGKSPNASSGGGGGNRKDDELTLNIRRLSEQIKHSSTYASYGNFHALTGTTATVAPIIKTSEGNMEKSASLLSDSLLETTC